MSSLREQALAALFAGLNANLLGTIRRADGSSATVPNAGALITQEDGTPEGERMLGDPAWSITHTVPILIEAKTREAVDAALLGIAAVVDSDPTLAGLVDWADFDGISSDAESPTGDSGQPLPRLQTANATVTMYYTAPTAAG